MRVDGKNLTFLVAPMGMKGLNPLILDLEDLSVLQLLETFWMKNG